MNDDVPVRGRAGGRAARKALRAAKPPISEAPVRPGMEGGQYLPLTDAEIQRIHHAALDVLEQIGLSNAIPSCIEIFTNAGATISDDGRLIIPRAMVEDALAVAARRCGLADEDGAPSTISEILDSWFDGDALVQASLGTDPDSDEGAMALTLLHLFHQHLVHIVGHVTAHAR